MITEITHRHYCNLGALGNPGCFSAYDDRAGRLRYYYQGNLSEACWMGWNIGGRGGG
jgi:hypothetical protein